MSRIDLNHVAAVVTDLTFHIMPPNPSVPIRHCPICGIAMQARKSNERLTEFDRFECLSCETTIELPQRHADRNRP